jgi:hypothetical protein
VILLLSTFVIYAIFKDLRNFDGKCAMFFVLGIAMTYAAFLGMKPSGTMLTKLFSTYLTCIGFVLAFMWLSVMIFDNFWNIK